MRITTSGIPTPRPMERSFLSFLSFEDVEPGVVFIEESIEALVVVEGLEDVAEEEEDVLESDITLCPARRIMCPMSIWNPSPLS